MTKGRKKMSIPLANHNKKFDKAIGLLTKAAADKKEEMQENLDRFGKMTKEAVEESGQKIKKTVVKVQKEVRKNPWAYIGSVAAAALTLGLCLGFTKKKTKKKKK